MFIFNVTSGENGVVATPKAPWISHLLQNDTLVQDLTRKATQG